ncbi:MFS transporter [Phycicoccus flavus]|uniref:MFS transporter n=1 Tax=Phycicoccus flavus TaxID=2502783 RepID=UPI000FEBCB3D|nr:MFS transporter [Phycicoccus flavus]NHA68276.1 MFS transporter [Phycicoccus flavus]
MLSSTRVEDADASTIDDPRRRRLVLATVGLALMTVVSAVSGLNVALPELATATGATQTQLTWVVDAYTVVFAGLLLLVGALGDRFGRRGVLVAGLAVFGLAAAGALFTEDPDLLVALRAVMGLGAAGIMPTTLSVITTSFPAAERPRAIGIWVGVAGGGAVIGLFGSGLLLEAFAWNSFFALNLGLAVLALAGALAFVPESREAAPGRLDVTGGVLSLVAVSGLVVGIIESAENGWGDTLTLSALAVGLLALAAFVAWELHTDDPLLDPRLFRERGFATGSLSISLQFFAMFGFFFAVLQYLQFVVGLSPLQAALRLLPLPFVLIPVARRAPHVAARLGFRRVGALGLALLALGLFTMSHLTRDLSPWVFFGGLVAFAAGAGLAGTPATTAITEALPPSKQGVASAVNDTARELGSALGIAVLGAALASAYRADVASVTAGLPEQAREAVAGSVAATRSPMLSALGPKAQEVVVGAQEAFVAGVGHALTIGAVVVAVGAVVVLLLAPGRERH